MEKEKKTMDKFLDIYENRMPTKEDFIKLVNPIEFDFSNDMNSVAAKKYRDLSREINCNEKEKNKRIIKKFFSYMAYSKRSYFKDKYNSNDKSFNEFFETASKKVAESNKLYGKIIDPDSESQLLQEIYKELWDDEKLEMTKEKNGNISGETLNSVNYTQNELYKFIENEEGNRLEKERRLNMKTEGGGRQQASIIYILSNFFQEEKLNTFKELIEIKELLEFLKSYHTIGNFMPIPVKCNPARGSKSNISKDYLDITLLFIYNYYMNGESGNKSFDKGIRKLMGRQSRNFEKWLRLFGEGQKGWDNFVKSNFFGDVEGKINFVPKIGDSYGCPRELWYGHFVQVINALLCSKYDVLPKSKEQCIDYFTNAKAWLSTRGEIMFDELERRLKESKEDRNG